MKKLFALLSTFVLTLAIVGLSVKSPAQAASSDKWTVDPTLAEDEIPMYEMGSIYTTFPNYYDNAAKADELWGGASRMYPWNETRLRVAQYDETGAATGKYYAIYFSGLTSATNSDGTPAMGAGNNINGYAYEVTKDAEGTVTSKVLTTVRVKSNTYGTDKEKFTYNATPADPSLSHIRYNFTGEDIVYNGITLATQIGDSSNAMNFYNRMFVMDGEGRIIRGVGMDSFYLQAGSDGAAADVWAPEFCYVDGVVTKYVEGETVCDTYKEQLKDEDGNLKYDDATGEPIYGDTELENFLYKRFVWEWFEEKPTNVNTASWKSEGWDCDLWDLVIDDPSGKGYLAIAFINGEGTNHKINDEEREITNATRKAAGKEELAAGDHYRECVAEIRVPAGGATFDFGYLDKGVVSEAAKFNNIIRGSFYSGRTVMTAEYKTYDFSVSGLKVNSRVIDEKSYQLMDRVENYVEVQQGVTFKPADIVNCEGLASMWKFEEPVDEETGEVLEYDPTDRLLSYSKDLETLDYTMYVSRNDKSVDGDMVVYKYEYAGDTLEDKKQAMIADYLKDITEYLEADGNATFGTSEGKKAVTINDLYPAGSLNWELAGNTTETFYGNETYRAKWLWLVNYVSSVRKASGLATSAFDSVANGVCASPATLNAEIYNFFTNNHRTSWPVSSNYKLTDDAGNDTSANAYGFMPPKFTEYSIDTSGDAVGTVYSVKFVVENTKTNMKDTMIIHYVVEDTYTPIIQVNEANLFITPRLVDGEYVIDAIDPMSFVTAYDAKYNGKTILGNDISHNVVFESATLDFDNPVEGTHHVKATVSTDAKHVAVKEFDVNIEDVTAPYAEFHSSLTLEYGALWTPELAVKSASDNVDGNLLNASFAWCIDISDANIKTTKAGKYTAKVAVYDATGNYVESGKITVTVLDKSLTASDLEGIEASLDGLTAKAEELGISSEELAEAVGKLPNIESIHTTVDNVVNPEKEGCGSSNTYFIQLLTAGTLLAFLLRKKH